MLPGLTSDDAAARLRAGLSEVVMSVAERETRVDWLRRHAPDAVQRIVADADQARAHVFDLLGSGPVSLGASIDWHADFQSGTRWDPTRFHRRIRPAAFPGGPDIKIPWELSRGQHLVRLGQAWAVTRQRVHAAELVAQIDAWIAANPWRLGVNWACAMDVAIRAVNWIWAIGLAADAKAVDDAFLARVAASLWQHGRHLADNLEGVVGRATNSNHYLSDLVGLAHIGAACRHLEEASSWRDAAVRDLWCELATQVLPDGLDHEGSIPYHRLVCELFLATLRLSQRAALPVPAWISTRIAAMLQATRAYTRPDGSVPIVGDQDNGRLLRLGTHRDPAREWVDHRHLLGTGGALLGRPELVTAATGELEEACWLGPLEGPGWHDAPAPSTAPATASHTFPDAGIHVLRSPTAHLVVTGGGSGTGGLGNHSHEDLLGFDLASTRGPLIVDPGTGVYTRDYAVRHRLRSAAAHNTVIIDGHGQAGCDPRQPFSLPGKVAAKVLRWEPDAEQPTLALERGQDRLVHARSFRLSRLEGCLEIEDSFDGAGDHELELRLHLLGGVVLADDRASARCSDPEISIAWSYGCVVRVDTYRYSPSYGLLLERPVLVLRRRTAFPCRGMTTTIRWT
ncbi:MAG: alginate lyase family protein [Deltaproteobacteria bacterium]|nr:alginate lyase family protein [Deltaproteobacteria bacterium]